MRRLCISSTSSPVKVFTTYILNLKSLNKKITFYLKNTPFFSDIIHPLLLMMILKAPQSFKIEVDLILRYYRNDVSKDFMFALNKSYLPTLRKLWKKIAVER